MRFTVVWTKVAEGQAAEIWLNAVDRGIAANTIDELDRALRDDPQEIGESRDQANRRLVTHRQLAAVFEVSEDDRLVTVLRVWSLE